MASVNKVILVGNLGHDPDVRFAANGNRVCHLTLATDLQWHDKMTGEKKEITEWHHVTLYQKLGEIAALYLKKGAQIYLEGRLQTRKWTDKDGIERYATEVIAEQMQMLGNRQRGPAQEQEKEHEQEAQSTAQDERGINDGADNPAAYVENVENVDHVAPPLRQYAHAGTTRNRNRNQKKRAVQLSLDQYTDDVPF